MVTACFLYYHSHDDVISIIAHIKPMEEFVEFCKHEVHVFFLLLQSVS